MAYRRNAGFSIGPVGYLILANIVMLIITYVYSDTIYLLGLRPADFLERPWALITSIFVHAGLWHLLGNMIALFFFGTYLIRLVGERNFLITYFCGGLLGNVLYLLLAPPLAIAVGASGAVFALGGALTVIMPQLRVLVFPIPAPLPLWVAILGGFLLMSFLPNVAWQAHLGGIAFGAIAGLIFRRRTRRFF